MIQLTNDICAKLKMARHNVINGINNGSIKGKKISDRIFMIDESEIPTTPEIPIIPQESHNTDSKPNLVQSAKDALEIARLNRDKDAIQKGFADFQKAEDDIKSQKEILAKDKEGFLKKLTDVEIREREAANTLLKAQNKLTDAENKLREYAARENEVKVKLERYETIKGELKELVAYYQANITPCINILDTIRLAIYTWIEPLNETKYDFSQLYNYIGNQTDKVERFIQKIKNTNLGV